MLIKGYKSVTIVPDPKKSYTKTELKCYICGMPAKAIHHIFEGRGKRQISDREHLTVPLCTKCHCQIHHNHLKENDLKKDAQKAWLESHDNDRAKWYQLFYKYWD